VEADTNVVEWDGNKVTFEVECDYKDRSGDDRYRGWVAVTVVADVV
jgi:hypothetical protein